MENTSDNSILNTILRTKLLSAESVETLCVDDVINPLVSVPLETFGFESQTWQSETLAAALNPSISFKIPLTIRKSSELSDDSKLPMPVNDAENLVYVGIQTLTTCT